MAIRYILLLALLINGPAELDAQDAPLVIGYLRSDGLAIPFAELGESGAVPPDRRTVDGVEWWYLHTWDGGVDRLGNGMPVNLADDWYDEWGVVTNYPPRASTTPVIR